MPRCMNVTRIPLASWTSPTVTVAGTSFQAGASAAFGAGITVGSTTVVSATQLTVALTIGSTATLGPRDVEIGRASCRERVESGGVAVASKKETRRRAVWA